MTKIQHVLPATPFHDEIIVDDTKPQAPQQPPQPEEEVKHGRLVKTLKRLEASEARKEDRAARRETYLVASGERDAALKLLEQRLGTSCERLESYLRCRFMVFDPKEVGKIDMADFGALLGLLRDGRDALDPEKQLMILDVDGDGMVSYLELVRWWLREEKLDGENAE